MHQLTAAASRQIKKIKVVLVLCILCLSQASHADWSEDQIRALTAILEWMQQGPQRVRQLPTADEITTAHFPFNYDRMAGIGHYQKGGKQHHFAIFSSPQELWLNLRAFAQLQGLSVSLLSLHLRKPSEILTAVWQEEIFELVFNWMKAHPGRFPGKKNFGYKKHQIPVSYERLTNTGHYGRGGGVAYFSSLEAFRLAQAKYSAERGLDVPDITRKKEPDARTEPISREEALERVLEWRKGKGKLPMMRDFGFSPPKILVPYARLVSEREYAPGGSLAHLGLFKDLQEFWLELKEYAWRQGEVIQLLHIESSGEMSADFRRALQREAAEIIWRWQDQHQRVPTLADFGYGHNQIPLFYPRLVSQSHYAKGRSRYGTRIFDNVAELEKYFKKFGTQRRVEGSSAPKDVENRQTRHEISSCQALILSEDSK